MLGLVDLVAVAVHDKPDVVEGLGVDGQIAGVCLPGDRDRTSVRPLRLEPGRAEVLLRRVGAETDRSLAHPPHVTE